MFFFLFRIILLLPTLSLGSNSNYWQQAVNSNKGQGENKDTEDSARTRCQAQGLRPWQGVGTEIVRELARRTCRVKDGRARWATRRMHSPARNTKEHQEWCTRYDAPTMSRNIRWRAGAVSPFPAFRIGMDFFGTCLPPAVFCVAEGVFFMHLVNIATLPPCDICRIVCKGLVFYSICIQLSLLQNSQ